MYVHTHVYIITYYIILLLYIMCIYYFVHKYADVCVCVRAYAFVPAHVTWHSYLLESTMRGSKDMFPKSLQIFHPAVDDHVCQAPDWFKIFPM